MKPDDFLLLKNDWIRQSEDKLVGIFYYYHSDYPEPTPPTYIWEIRVVDEKPFMELMEKLFTSDLRVNDFIWPNLPGKKLFSQYYKDRFSKNAKVAKYIKRHALHPFDDWKTMKWELNNSFRKKMYPTNEFYLNSEPDKPVDIDDQIISTMKPTDIYWRCSSKQYGYNKVDFPGVKEFKNFNYGLL